MAGTICPVAGVPLHDAGWILWSRPSWQYIWLLLLLLLPFVQMDQGHAKRRLQNPCKTSRLSPFFLCPFAEAENITRK